MQLITITTRRCRQAGCTRYRHLFMHAYILRDALIAVTTFWMHKLHNLKSWNFDICALLIGHCMMLRDHLEIDNLFYYHATLSHAAPLPLSACTEYNNSILQWNQRLTCSRKLTKSSCTCILLQAHASQIVIDSIYRQTRILRIVERLTFKQTWNCFMFPLWIY